MAGATLDSSGREDSRAVVGRPGDDIAPQLDTFRYDDQITRMFATATMIWGAFATLVGLLVAIMLVLPRLFYPLEDLAEYLTFARLRPLHTNTALFAFVGNAVFAAVYYSTQRLCQTRMWSDALSRLHFWGWQVIILAAVVTLPLGINQGREFAEMEWPIDLAIAIVWIGFFGVNFFVTLIRRRERHMYASLWFYIATVVTFSVLHVANNLVLPAGLGKSYPLYAGVQDALMQWWYGHNAMAFLLIMPFLGLMYYFLPKAADRPLFSYRLAIVHFWAIVLICVWAGPHHVQYSPLPEWLGTLSMLFGLMLWMPFWGGMVNGLLTLRGAWDRVASDPVLKFFVAALVFYGVATFDGSLMGIKSVNAMAHYTDWSIAHIHVGALGWNGMMTFGMLYWMLPRLFQTPIWSPRLVGLHFWVSTIGILLYVVPIYGAGATEGVRWLALDEMGRLAYPEFLDVLRMVKPLWWARIIGGALFVIGVLMLGVNHVMTWRSRPRMYDQPLETAPPRIEAAPLPRPLPPSRLEGAPVLDLGKRMESFAWLGWHRRWERQPVKFGVLVMLAIALGSLAEMIPTFLIRSSVPRIATVEPYTPLELAGRDIYVAQGCFNCHSQMIRPLVAETQRYGEFSKPGEFVYDHPVLWGSRRIGPDLAREGGRNTSFWHWDHLEDPQRVSEGSVMPPFDHLLDTELDFEKITERVEAAHWLGAPYDQELTEAPQMARRQAEEIAAEVISQGGPVRRTLADASTLMIKDSQAIALIAYLQRLGTDLYRVPPAESGADGATPEGATPEGAGDAGSAEAAPPAAAEAQP